MNVALTFRRSLDFGGFALNCVPSLSYWPSLVCVIDLDEK